MRRKNRVVVEITTYDSITQKRAMNLVRDLADDTIEMGIRGIQKLNFKEYERVYRANRRKDNGRNR